MFIVDERSMLGSGLLAAASNIRDRVYGQQNQNETWGGIPVVLLFGDNYQLPPVAQEGAISGFSKNRKWKNTDKISNSTKTPEEQRLIDRGHDLFINDLTQHVFHLKNNHRSKDDPELVKILANLRIADLDDAGGDRLMDQMIEHHELNIQAFLHNHKKQFTYTPKDTKKT